MSCLTAFSGPVLLHLPHGDSILVVIAPVTRVTAVTAVIAAVSARPPDAVHAPLLLAAAIILLARTTAVTAMMTVETDHAALMIGTETGIGTGT